MHMDERKYAISSRVYRSVVMTSFRVVHDIEPLRLPTARGKVSTAQIGCALPRGWFDGRSDLSSHSSAVDRNNFANGRGGGVWFQLASQPFASPANSFLVMSGYVYECCVSALRGSGGKCEARILITTT